MSTNTETTTKVVRRPPVKDFNAAIKAYYSMYISNGDIKRIFGCGANTAVNLKKLARELEIEKNVPTCVPKHVNSRIAFEAWHIEITELEKNRQKLIKLGLIEETPIENLNAKEKAPQSGSCDATN